VLRHMLPEREGGRGGREGREGGHNYSRFS
jgi:hypothetical protein